MASSVPSARRNAGRRGHYLREKKKDVEIALADPWAPRCTPFAHGELPRSEGSSITEGIGLGTRHPDIEGSSRTCLSRFPTRKRCRSSSTCSSRKGLCVGGSTGINVAGAIRLAKELGPGHTIVTILADYGTRYQSKLFNPDFLRRKRLPVPEWLERKPNVKVPYE